MRTRSQPISPNGFQSLEIAPRRRKAQTTATASRATKVTKPAAEASAKVEKKKPGKRGPKKTSKKTASKSNESLNSADSSSDAPAPVSTDAASVNAPNNGVKDIATNQEPVEQSITDKFPFPRQMSHVLLL
ncbi:conserved hypothetical protein [Histoplasma capsulatum var. duboisii H88]|uniref:Uncharacterized protein n=1 Tax=Ajellomyces capsulatus (strain H88) TaxID=544711 RepID=F0UDL6_AJEC8|nr:conserved hypothetical protein [Histoplasma capsulatum var. duboisii H88]